VFSAEGAAFTKSLGSAPEFIQSRKTLALKARFISSSVALSALVLLRNPVAWGGA
jgi:hypothetical protein